MEVASTFPDAVLKLVNDYPSAAIIDLSAGNDAWKLAERLKGQNFVVPILLVSEQPLNDEDTDRALAVGAKAVLTAVVTVEQVAAELDSVMERCLLGAQ